MTDKELKILEILRGSIDALSAEEIAVRIYGDNSPQELVKSKLHKLEYQGYIERFYTKNSYKFLITENGENVEQIEPNEQIVLDFFEEVEVGNKKKVKNNEKEFLESKESSKDKKKDIISDKENNKEKSREKQKVSSIKNSVGNDNDNKNDDKEEKKSLLKKGFKGIFTKNNDFIAIKSDEEKVFSKEYNDSLESSLDMNLMNNDLLKEDNKDDDNKDFRQGSLEFIDKIKQEMAMEEKVELEGIFNKENQLKQQFNKAWSEILKEEKDYYSLMDDRSFSLLKSALNNINCISTFRTTIAFIKRLENIFDISEGELQAIEEDSRALKVNDSSFDVEHLGEINIVAEIKCNVSTNGSNRFGAGLTASLKKDIDSLINGKPRSRIKDVKDCYKFMVIYKNDEIIDDAIRQLIDGLPNDLSKYLIVYRDGMIMSKDYVYIYVM